MFQIKYIYTICYTLTQRLIYVNTLTETTHNISVTLYNSVDLVDPDNSTFTLGQWSTNATKCNNPNLHLCSVTSQNVAPIFTFSNCETIFLQVNCTKKILHIKNVTTETPVQYTLTKSKNSETVQRHNFTLQLVYPTSPPPPPNETETIHAEASRSEAGVTIVTPVTVVTGGVLLAGLGYAYMRGWCPKFLKRSAPKRPMVTTL
ncbi:membrane protein RL11F [Cercopithecine betaherpesvirus 5]|uniref:Membrane protein RL11F n=1 Tax=Simian cytomegalovirus (strain Colburn) TaxID=50292 RepID=G8XTQ7_SCMVC|nr:membrane protein RL11F [Cercopithecine betaherpesvirus 5]